MLLAKSFDLSPDQMAELNFEFAYSIGYLEWFHSCVRRLRGGIESSLSSGNTRIGFLCAGLSTIFSVISGEKELTSLLKEIDYYLHLLETYRNELAKVFLLISRDAVSTMIDKGEATSIKTNESVGAEDDDRPRKVLEMIYFHGTIQNYWIGYSERCFHFAQKCFDLFHKPGRLYRVVILYYHGLNLCDMLKKKANASRRKEVKKIIASLRLIVSHADSNFRNKLELLEAEQHALDTRHTQAVKCYDAAIASAKSFKFIHEQGLACEKAGFYCRKIGSYRNSMRYFEQARTCYEEWGSRVKVEAMEKEMSAMDVLNLRP